MQRQNDRQHRDQDLERARHPGRHFRRQANGDVMPLEEGVQLGGIDGHQNGGEDPLAGEVGRRDLAIFQRRGHQQKRHQRQHSGGQRVQVMVLGEAGGDPDGNEQGHHPHAEVERQHQRIAMIERKLQPGAGKAPRRIRRKRRKDKYQQKRADDHKGQGGDKTVADRGHVFLLADRAGQRRDLPFDHIDQFSVQRAHVLSLVLVFNEGKGEIEDRGAFLHAVVHHIDGFDANTVFIRLFLQILLHVFHLRP